MTAGGNFLKYIKTAFTYHWNLLFLGAGTVLGVISGYPDIVLPIIAAGEIGYLALLSTHPRFQSAVNAQGRPVTETPPEEGSPLKVQQILEAIHNEDRRRFEKLRDLCLEMRRFVGGVKEPAALDPAGITDLQIEGINRLLWIYLKLLYSKYSLKCFFETIDEQELRESISRTEERLAALGPQEEDDPREILHRKSLIDTLETYHLRLKNLQAAQENYNYIELELERLYSKIASIAEMGISRQDPNFISSEIDVVSSSVHQTEKTMSELEFLTGLSSYEETAPRLLEEIPRTVKARRR